MKKGKRHDDRRRKTGGCLINNDLNSAEHLFNKMQYAASFLINEKKLHCIKDKLHVIT